MNVNRRSTAAQRMSQGDQRTPGMRGSRLTRAVPLATPSAIGHRYALLVAFLIGLFASARDAAGDCGACGCHAGCRKVCRLVEEEKKVTVTCWGYKCDEFCVPGPSCPCREHCECVCQECSTKSGVHSQPKRFVWTDWLPNRCGEVLTKTKLMKRTVTKKVPGYKWVVEDRCPSCCNTHHAVAGDVSAPLPPLPPGVTPDTHLILVPRTADMAAAE